MYGHVTPIEWNWATLVSLHVQTALFFNVTMSPGNEGSGRRDEGEGEVMRGGEVVGKGRSLLVKAFCFF